MESGNTLPLVSIIITSFNRAGMITKAIESALMQDYPNLEVIVSDNCSSDDTENVVAKYSNDIKFRFSRNSMNIGMIPNFRKATYEVSKGEYLTYISSDDFLTDKSFVSDAMGVVARNPNIEIVHGRMSF